jgi:RNA polymerase sigma-70 factor, ECF subfamily
MEIVAKKDLPKGHFFKNINALANHKLQNTARAGHKLTDEELMKLYKKGDNNAFRIIMSRYQKPVYNFLYRLLGNSELAEEAFQETFLRVIKSVSDYKPTARFSTWVYTIARNYSIDVKRKGRFRNHYSLDSMTAPDSTYSGDEILRSEAHVSETAVAHDLDKHLRRILDEINPEQKEVFLLRQFQEMSFEEISKVTGSSLNTVKSRMRYAIQTLQKRFSELGIDSL